jgi:thioredoxin-related protein
MKPIVHGLEDRYRDEINFVYLDIDDPQTDELKKMLLYRNRPHFVLLDGTGNMVNSWIGIVDEADFVAAFEALLN